MKPLLSIFLTVFIDLIGFGIIIPLSPFLAREFQASPLQIGFLLTIYSLMQFLFSPFWGSLSDRVGRRPVILISLLGGSASYLLFAFADQLWLLFLARGMAGVFGGNISAAHAYMADVTTKENRSKGMGLIGAAFGLGFVVGPILGGLLGHWGQMIGSAPPFGESFSALGASAICFANFVFSFFVLKESLPPEKRKSQLNLRPSRFAILAEQLRRPVVGSLIWVFFLSGLAMAQMEAMLFNFMADRFGWTQITSSYGFAYVGVIMVFTQGYLIRKIMPKWGEALTLRLGLAGFAISLIGVGWSPNITTVAISMTLLALANGCMRPPNVGMISVLTPADEQGAVMGVTNSVASLGRILGPILGGWLYGNLGPQSPFLFASALVWIAWVMIYLEKSQLPQTHGAAKPA